MTTIKYVVCPGYVTSRTDGQRHFVGWRQLVKLYGLAPESYMVKPAEDDPHWRVWRPPDNAIYLYPRADGNYRRRSHES